MVIILIPNFPDPSSQEFFFDYTEPNQLDIFTGIAVDTIAIPPSKPVPTQYPSCKLSTCYFNLSQSY
jgi:hypothetical protein